MATHTCGHTNSILTFAAFAAQKMISGPQQILSGAAQLTSKVQNLAWECGTLALCAFGILEAPPPGFNAKILTAGQRFQLEGCCWEQQNLEPQIAKGNRNYHEK